MRITHCKTGHLTNPLGYDLTKPVLTWTVEDAAGQSAEAARIVVSDRADLSFPLTDTGFRADISSLGCTPSLHLRPRTRYYWQVTVRSNAGEEAQSELNWFETAKGAEPWAGEWIGCGGRRHPVYAKSLPVTSLSGAGVASARLYICGLGLYTAVLNGQRIGDEYLTPYCNNYDAWVQYQTYDITRQLARGGRLRVILGDGWYKGRFNFRSAPEDPGFYGDQYRMIAEVRIVYEDGTKRVIGTDRTWQMTRGPVVFSNLYDGEHYDALAPREPWVPAVVCGPPKGALVPRFSPPVKVFQEFPVTMLRTPAGETVLDVGQNIAGIFRLSVHLPAGAEARLQFGEQLQDGNFYRDNLRTARAEYKYRSDGKARVLMPRFTFYGYRYVKVEGIPNLKPEDFTALALTTDNEELCEMTTGHGKVNQLLSNINWGRRDNFIDVPTDCPQRDERMGWTGDTQVFASTALYQSDAYAFYRKFLRDMAAEQDMAQGMVPKVVPACGISGSSGVWGDCCTILPWEMYLASGDSSILSEHYPYMKAWVDYVTRVDGDDGGWRRDFHFGDWLALDRPGGADQVEGATDVGFLADVYYRHSAHLTAKAGRLLGYEKEAKVYDALADAVKARIEADFYTREGKCRIETQTAQVVSLRYGLGSPDLAAAELRRLLEDNGGKLNTGFVGTPLLCDVLSEHGMGDLAEDLLLNEDYPGWLHEVNLGATTVWERWNSLDEEGHFSSAGMNSLNHYAYGSVAGWMYRYLAGLRPVTPGYLTASVAPHPLRALGWLDFSCRTAAGTYRISWKWETETALSLSVTVPFGAAAELALPLAGPEVYEDPDNPMFAQVRDGVCVLPAGQYAVTYSAAGQA